MEITQENIDALNGVLTVTVHPKITGKRWKAFLRTTGSR